MGKDGRVTVGRLAEMKQAGEKIAMLTAYDFFTAKAIDEAGIDIILVGDTLGMAFAGHETTLPVRLKDVVYHSEIVSRAARRAMVVGDMPFLTYQVTPQAAVENAGQLMQDGKVQAVKLEGGRIMVPTIRLIVRSGIPVMGHIGLTPQSVYRFGGWRVQGKDPESAQRLRDASRALEDAGCFAIVLEAIPAQLAAEISQQLSIPTIGIGAGPACDGQVLVTPDMLGITGFESRYLKVYAKLGEVMREAFRAYLSDVRNGKFPTQAHAYRGE